ncbi:MAG: hypothetical protein ACI8Y4_005211 [Candidatus Poriferisodalaceae bacterium]|jgi:hypothetical protein
MIDLRFDIHHDHRRSVSDVLNSHSWGDTHPKYMEPIDWRLPQPDAKRLVAQAHDGVSGTQRVSEGT